MQTTIASPVTLSGVGVHSGRYATMKMFPARANTGIVFCRTDIEDADCCILAHAQNAIEAQLCTRIENSAGIGVTMIEHVMAAFHALGIDNILIEIDSSEVPILDGSSAQIVELLHRAGTTSLDAPRHYIEIIAPVMAKLDNGAWAELSPADSLQIDIDIDFDDPGIGKQACHFDSALDDFADEIAHARTFCLHRDVEKMQQAGLGKGGSLQNAIVYRDGEIMNEGGLRMDDECVKHKALDCIGDLFLLGMAVKGKLTAHMPGHRLSTILVRKMLESPESFRIVTQGESLAVSAAGTMPAMAVANSA